MPTHGAMMRWGLAGPSAKQQTFLAFAVSFCPFWITESVYSISRHPELKHAHSKCHWAFKRGTGGT